MRHTRAQDASGLPEQAFSRVDEDPLSLRSLQKRPSRRREMASWGQQKSRAHSTRKEHIRQCNPDATKHSHILKNVRMSSNYFRVVALLPAGRQAGLALREG